MKPPPGTFTHYICVLPSHTIEVLSISEAIGLLSIDIDVNVNRS